MRPKAKIATRALSVMILAATACGCVIAVERPTSALKVAPGSATIKLLHPDDVTPGRLAYAPDGRPFAPFLTGQAPYPTQAQANDAYQRTLSEQRAWARRLEEQVAAPSSPALDSEPELPTAVRLFGCKPGWVDNQSARIHRPRGPVAHCATDFLDAFGRAAYRETVNFFYVRGAWRMQIADPPRAPVAWRARERSPTDPWRWLPGRARYE